MKRIIPLVIVIVAYVLFLMLVMAPSEHPHEVSGVGELVTSHLTDNVIKHQHASHKDNVITTQLKAINNAIAHVNEGPLKDKLFGVFDMRITRWVMMMWLAFLLCLVVFIPLAFKLKREKMGSDSKWVNMWEALIIYFVYDNIVEPNFEGKYVKKAIPYFATLFFFVLFCNLLGLLPGMSTATGNLAVTGGLAVLTLCGMIGVGVVKQGPLWFYKGTVPHGVPFILGILLLWPIELVGLLIKPFALTVRLFANMTAGHVVILIFIFLVMMFQNLFVGIGSVLGSLMIYMLELLVAFIQAFIFAGLSAMFIGSSMHAH
ncbi:MAG TPA: F0F1 ATP synthase subunit A [Spirochaetota bacterium]|nr:F0F1 ATP synthase subunit A [Spirochaetota bacterium]HPC42795.1 F0F1 ATP synthase subunit A [Spirochaetota bacterium]HPL15969.1 F0F1 ATP synthase subunit A [Spirochaetota bacterium]HQJ72555.1 F0F1 ATP synthase subunit A [Spirochaetota bacterium]HRS77244.1 F0F1 ATP synthase subunit A [Spirochaetota bacterium]